MRVIQHSLVLTIEDLRSALEIEVKAFCSHSEILWYIGARTWHNLICFLLALNIYLFVVLSADSERIQSFLGSEILARFTNVKV